MTDDQDEPAHMQALSSASVVARSSGPERWTEVLDWVGALLDGGEGWISAIDDGFRWHFSALAMDLTIAQERGGLLCAEARIISVGENTNISDLFELVNQFNLQSGGWSFAADEQHGDVAVRCTLPVRNGEPWWMHWAGWALPRVAAAAEGFLNRALATLDAVQAIEVPHPSRGLRPRPDGHIEGTMLSKFRSSYSVGFPFAVADLGELEMELRALFGQPSFGDAPRFEDYDVDAYRGRLEVYVGAPFEFSVIDPSLGWHTSGTEVWHPEFGRGIQFVGGPLVARNAQAQRRGIRPDVNARLDPLPFEAHDVFLSVLPAPALIADLRNGLVGGVAPFGPWVRTPHGCVFNQFFVPYDVLEAALAGDRVARIIGRCVLAVQTAANRSALDLSNEQCSAYNERAALDDAALMFGFPVEPVAQNFRSFWADPLPTVWWGAEPQQYSWPHSDIICTFGRFSAVDPVVISMEILRDSEISQLQYVVRDSTAAEFLAVATIPLHDGEDGPSLDVSAIGRSISETLPGAFGLCGEEGPDWFETCNAVYSDAIDSAMRGYASHQTDDVLRRRVARTLIAIRDPWSPVLHPAQERVIDGAVPAEVRTANGEQLIAHWLDAVTDKSVIATYQLFIVSAMTAAATGSPHPSGSDLSVPQRRIRDDIQVRDDGRDFFIPTTAIDYP